MSRNNTGNPIDSKAFPDFEDNVKNLDQAVNAEQDTFQDRLGKSRLTWAGIVKAGTGDAGVIVPIVQQAAQDAASEVIAGVDGQVAVAQSAAIRAEAAADIASTAGLIFPTSAEGQASSELTAGDYFWVESGSDGGLLELWRKGAATPTNTGRTTVSENLVATVQGAMTPRRELWEESSNLLNASTNTIGKRIEPGGDIVDNPSWGHTDYIPVVPGGSYVSTSFTAATFYDASLGYISRNGATDPTGEPWITPARTRFVRLNYNLNNTEVPTARVNAGTTLRDYEPYYRKLKKGIEITSDNIVGDVLHGAMFKDNSIGPKGVSFIEESPNLFNSDTVLWHHIIRVNGDLDPFQNTHLSDFIPVSQNGTYTISGSQSYVFNYVAQYDADKQFIVRGVGGGNGTNITVGPRCAYVRLMFQGSSVERVFSKGTSVVPYQPYWAKLKGVDVEIPVRIGAFVYPFSADGVFDGIDYSSWWPGYGQSTLSGEVYQRWDDLAADYPDVITKQVLGDDDFGNEISAYHISAGSPSSAAALKKPKIFTVSSIHGSEKAPAHVTYLFYRDMLERANEYKELSALMYNADHIIIPVANPSGFNLFQRRNGNGVDINRNFPEGWVLGDPSASTYGGPSPLSEPEAQYISQVMDENPDISICNDFHNFHGTESTTDFIWVATGSGAHTQHMAVSLIERMTSKWRPEYPWFPQDRSYFAGYTDGTTGAMVQDHARARGITFTALFEICYRWRLDPDGTTYDAVVQKTGVEAWANWLLINLRELEKITYR